MANEKILDMTKSAAVNETAVNEKFEELSQQGGGGVEPATIVDGKYKTTTRVGENVDLPSTPARFITDYNSLRMMRDMADTRINVSVEYGHEPAMLIHNGKAYITYFYHPSGNGEGWDSPTPENRPKSRLSIVNLSTNTIEKSEVYAEVGDTFTLNGETKTMTYAGSNNIVLIDNNTIRLLFVAGMSGSPSECVCHIDYNISAGTFGDVGVCYITKNGSQPVVATNVSFGEVIETGNNGLGVSCQYAHINDRYYIAIGNGISGKNGNIFTTTDFITFTWFASPSIPSASRELGLVVKVKDETTNEEVEIAWPLGFEFEMAVYPWTDAYGEVCLYLGIRTRSTIKKLIVAKMYTGLVYDNGQFVASDKAAGSIQDNYYGYKILPCNSNRPCFFAPATNDFLSTRAKSGIFLCYDNVAQPYPRREYSDICTIVQNTFESEVVKISQCLYMTYPSFVYHDGWYYVAYQGMLSGDPQPHVFLSKFKPFTANFDKVVEVLNKVLDTFEPNNT